MTTKQTTEYGDAPRHVGRFDFDLKEVMYYLYLPVRMGNAPRYTGPEIRIPPNVECCRPLIAAAMEAAPRRYRYAYLSARKGWATPDNPLNRPGWHCDGFGTDDMNYVWWSGPGTRFAVQPFKDISDDHVESLRQFDAQIQPEYARSYPERALYELHPKVIHATPLIDAPGCMRQFVKISFSDHCYNLENNSHNYLFDYAWPMSEREMVRNDTHTSQRDYGASP